MNCLCLYIIFVQSEPKVGVANCNPIVLNIRIFNLIINYFSDCKS